MPVLNSSKEIPHGYRSAVIEIRESSHRPITGVEILIGPDPADIIHSSRGYFVPLHRPRTSAVISLLAPKTDDFSVRPDMSAFYRNHFQARNTQDTQRGDTTFRIGPRWLAERIAVKTAFPLFLESPISEDPLRASRLVYGGLLILPKKYIPAVRRRGFVVVDDLEQGNREAAIGIPRSLLGWCMPKFRNHLWLRELLPGTTKTLLVGNLDHLTGKNMGRYRTIVTSMNPVALTTN